jgi:hypothetical protein
MFDAIFHGPPTSSAGSGGTAALGIDVSGAQLYYKDPTSKDARVGWIPLNGGVISASAFVGADIGVQVNKAAASLNGFYGTIFIPAGTYTYSTDIYLPTPCRLLMDTGTVLNYVGTGNAIKVGPDGLTVNNFQFLPYIIQGGQMTGGATMTNGIYFSPYVVNTFLLNVQMLNFGNAQAWNVFYQSQNWYNVIENLWLWSTPNFSQSQNGIRLNGAADSGQSRLFVTDCLLQPGTVSGTGIYINGYNAIVRGSTISGGWTKACVQFGGWSSTSVLYDCTIEMSLGGSVILIGDSSGAYVGNFLDGVQILDTQADIHNTERAVAFASPASTSSVIRNWRVEGLRIADMANGTNLFTLNNLAGQTGNYASNNLYQNNNSAFNLSSLAGKLHNTGNNISFWIGDDEVEVVNGGLVIPNTTSPTSAGTAGITGQIAWDATNIYVCTAGGAAGAATWNKSALSAA